jgi:hypothetical protein
MNVKRIASVWDIERRVNASMREPDAARSPRRCPMSMDSDYQTKDPTYNTINKKLIIGVILLAAVIIGLWFYISSLFEGPSLL